MLGRKSETSMPHWPRLAKGRQGGRSLFLATARRVLNVPKDSGIGWPARRTRSGLGSNRSTWLGPPDMKRKITLLALGWKWGCLGERALFDLVGASDSEARRFCESSSEARARSPKPPPA